MIAPVILVMLWAAAVCAALAFVLLLAESFLIACGVHVDFSHGANFLLAVAVTLVLAALLTGSLFGFTWTAP